jgi:hypothetical protein
MRVKLDFTNANTAASTINLNGLGAKNIHRNNAVLAAGEIPAGGLVTLTYDGTQFNMEAVKIYAADVIDAGTVVTYDIGVANTNIPQMDATGYPAADGSQITDLAPANVTGGILPRGWIDGLILSNDPTDPAKDIGIAAGAVRDDGDAADIKLSSALIKKLDASWAVGTNQGALDGTESVAGTPDADTWYHIWAIKRSDTGIVDILASESATSPTMPTNYDLKQRIGAILFDSTPNIVGFIQTHDTFKFKTPDSHFWDSSPPTTAQTVTCTVPTGLVVDIIFTIILNGTTSPTNDTVYVSSLAQDDVSPAFGNGLIATIVAEGNNTSDSATVYIVSNTSGQLRVRSEDGGSSHDLVGITVGWVDPRGRNT